jgi:hypothetical protein
MSFASKRIRFGGLLSAAAVGLLAGSSAHAALLVDFKPNPSDSKPEITFTQVGPDRVLAAGLGAIGTGDGEAYVQSATAMASGGLFLQTPVVIPTIGFIPVAHYGGTVTPTATTFEDTTLVLSDLKAAGSDILTLIPDPDGPGPLTGISIITQAFTPGHFELWSTAPTDSPSGEALLLSGDISGLLVTGIVGSQSSSMYTGNLSITYTGGAILSAWEATGGTNMGDLSISLLNLIPSVAGDPPPGQLQPFISDATGIFSAVPEPSALGLMGLSSLALIARRRKSK